MGVYDGKWLDSKASVPLPQGETIAKSKNLPPRHIFATMPLHTPPVASPCPESPAHADLLPPVHRSHTPRLQRLVPLLHLRRHLEIPLRRLQPLRNPRFQRRHRRAHLRRLDRPAIRRGRLQNPEMALVPAPLADPGALVLLLDQGRLQHPALRFLRHRFPDAHGHRPARRLRAEGKHRHLPHRRDRFSASSAC